MKWIKNRLKSVYFRYWIQVDVQFFLSSLAHSRCLLSGFVLLMLFFFFIHITTTLKKWSVGNKKKSYISNRSSLAYNNILWLAVELLWFFFMWFLLEVIKNIVRDWHRMKWLRGRHTPHFPKLLHFELINSAAVVCLIRIQLFCAVRYPSIFLEDRKIDKNKQGKKKRKIKENSVWKMIPIRVTNQIKCA